MSGITGIFLRDNGSVDPELIKKMNKSIAHRGPDGSEEWVEGSVALGHQMLHTTPESLHEKLPIKDPAENMVITADARIDNREELMESLGIISSPGMITDSEIILKAYQKWGEKCPEELLGDFAFAIWDETENKLFCARDHMGVKPFYYYISDELFVFASEIKALFVVPEVPRQLNEEQISEYLAMIYEDKTITAYNDIDRLPAASSITITFQDSGFRQYWVLDPDFEICFDSDEEYMEAFMDIFTEAVRCRLRSAFPVGSMLSGGLDSSSVVCVAQKILNEHGKYPLKTFSAIFESVPESDESYFIKKVLESDNFDSYFIEADKISPLADIDDYLFFRDQPIIAPNSFMSWNIYREAGKNGVRVLLDGFDGDTVVSYGEGYAMELLHNIRWKKFLVDVRGRSKLLNINPYKTFFKLILNNLIPNVVKRLSWFLREYYGRTGSNTRIIKTDLAKRVNLIEKLGEIHKNEMDVVYDAKARHYRAVNSGLVQAMLEFVDWFSTPFLIEARHPFFDKRLVEFCLAIPTEQKRWNGWDRSILRRALKNILPIEIQWRKGKANLAPNFNRSLMKFEEPLIDEILFENTYLIKDYVDVVKLKNIYINYKSGNTKDYMHIWNTLTLALWLRKNRLIIQ
ncbi:MAG: lasso peptide isopeptide bond-forming cyclase [Methanobacterium sp.]